MRKNNYEKERKGSKQDRTGGEIGLESSFISGLADPIGCSVIELVYMPTPGVNVCQLTWEGSMSLG